MKIPVLFFLAIFSLVSKISLAQKSYLNFNSSLHLSAPNSYSGSNEEQVLPDEITLSNTRGNFGSGYSFGLEYLYQKQSNVMLGFSFSSFYGNEVMVRNYAMNNLYQHLSGKSRQLRFSPSVTFVAEQKKLTFYMQTALVLPLKSETAFSYTEFDYTAGTSKKYTEDYKYNFVFGFQQNIGARMKLTKHWKLSASFGFLLLNQATKSRRVSSYQVNNQDQLGSLSTYEKETAYQQNLSNYSNNSAYNDFYDSTKAKEELRNSHSFNSFSLQFSIIYNFHKSQ